MAAPPHFRVPPPVQVGYTDLATPRTAYDLTNQPELPLGASQDDSRRTHVSRIYATFDLTQFAGTRVIGGTVRIRETAAADCTKRAIDMWQTRPISRTPSWATAPDEIRKLDGIQTPEFCPAIITFDVSAAVRDAVAYHAPRVTFEIRVPANHEHDVTYGRRLSAFTGVGLTVEYNSAPSIVASARFNGGVPCVESAPFPALGGFADTLQALATDPDVDDRSFGLHYEFAVWPADNPAARTVLTRDGDATRVATVNIPAGVLVDGHTYAWQVRVSDGADTSPWSGVCSFIDDQTDPRAPQVSSVNYPPDTAGQTPLGEPGVFTFHATDAETVGFQYAWEILSVPGCEQGSLGQLVCPDPFASPDTVRADAPGGTATVTLNPPRTTRNRLLVRSIDNAGRRSPQVAYDIFVPFGGTPTISVVGPQPQWNQQVVLKFAPYPGITGTVDYTYQLDFSPAQTIAAGPDGTATISFTATNAGGHQVTVRSRSANGWVSPQGSWSVTFVQWPGVLADIYLDDGEAHGGVGVPGTFTFTPPAGVLQVAGYNYSFDPFGGADFVFVPAGPDGRATISWAPEVSGFVDLEVQAVRPDGTSGGLVNDYFFEVAE